jgi:hypothetical protein
MAAVFALILAVGLHRGMFRFWGYPAQRHQTPELFKAYAFMLGFGVVCLVLCAFAASGGLPSK